MSLVSTEWLAAHSRDADVRVCDVRWYLKNAGKTGRSAFEAGHVPGAVFVDLDTELAAPDDGRAGRHPLPAREVFVEALRRHGIGPGTHVVAYDDAGGAIAARLWWLLRAHGHERVSILDGGFPAWTREGRPVSTEAPAYPRGAFESRWNDAAAVSLEETRRQVREGALLLDARARERYRGDVEPVDPRAGHIPGAVSLPTSELLADGRFLAPALLAERLGQLDVGGRAVITSCGSGVTACHLAFALDHSGLRPFPAVKLYVGSFSEWSRRAELPVARGDAPGEPS